MDSVVLQKLKLGYGYYQGLASVGDSTLRALAPSLYTTSAYYVCWSFVPVTHPTLELEVHRDM